MLLKFVLCLVICRIGAGAQSMGDFSVPAPMPERGTLILGFTGASTIGTIRIEGCGEWRWTFGG